MTEQTSLSELFATDPLKLTVEDRTRIIAHYRENRERYVNAATAPKAAKAKKSVPEGGISLADLGL